MNAFIYQNPVKVYFGEGTVEKGLSTELARVGQTVLLVYGGGSIKRNGLYDQIIEILARAGKTVVEYAGVTPNPRYAEVQEVAARARETKADFLLAVGGGSVIDCVRSAAVQALLDEDLWTWELDEGNVPTEALPYGIVLTLGGTGSDLNWLAGINNEERHNKGTLAGTYAQFDIIDPVVTLSVPRRQFVTGAFDTLSHYMEQYFGRGGGISDDIMVALMRGVVTNLRAALALPDDLAPKSDLLWASSLALSGLPGAGKVGDFTCHGIEHWISGYTDANHGRTLSILHPVVYRHVWEGDPARFARFAREVMGVDAAGMDERACAVAGIDALYDFISEIGLPHTWEQEGIEMDDATMRAIADRCTSGAGCPAPLDHDDIYQILRECAE